MTLKGRQREMSFGVEAGQVGKAQSVCKWLEEGKHRLQTIRQSPALLCTPISWLHACWPVIAGVPVGP